MRVRRVVTCFLRHPDGRRVLLGLRSNQVNTYAGHWAAISGGVEDGEPLSQAFVEIEEETGLARCQVELVGAGWPIRHYDWGIGIVWVIYPFLFDCLSPESVRRDREHVRFEWTEPARIGELKTVPQLAGAYEAAVIAARGGRLDSARIFGMVAGDRVRGAEELGLWTLAGLRTAVEEAARNVSSPAELLESLRAACRLATSLRPGMAPPTSAALDAWEACKRALSGGEADAARLCSAIEAIERRREQAVLESGERAAGDIPRGAHVVTLSYSATALVALREARGRLSLLTVGESRPACEGRRTAQIAASFGVAVELVTDAAACSAMRTADVALLGADALMADGGFANKTGSLALCAAARAFGKLVLVVATESKVMPAGAAPGVEEQEPAELGEAVEGVTLRNPCFDAVPAELVGRIVTENGPLSAERLAARARTLAELMREVAQ
jgi:translation initiation factor 2B subunit (eIF-2B alpha/beta/delta family)/8-oxo-dGTP pyrophosphatase MutT (NUDIX family)